jgi:antitoxin (DNA-binding transcriptional repressor) of toxin-antitoxin stability system
MSPKKQYEPPKMNTLSVKEAREHFADTLNRVAYRGERIILQRRGVSCGAALVPAEDVALIERLEDILDDLEADEALSDSERVPWTKVKKELGL